MKHKADMKVIKRKAVIQNAKDLFTFAKSNLKTPVLSCYQEKVCRDHRGQYFKEVKGNEQFTVSFLEAMLAEFRCHLPY